MPRYTKTLLAALTLLAAMAFLAVTNGKLFAAVTSCSLKFEVVAEKELGSIAIGEKLQGTIDFSIRSSMQQGVETVSYLTVGTMRLAAAGRGAVSGKIGVVHVTRTPYTADYISIDASQVSGDLGGVHSYVDPMLVTLYAAPGTLASSAIPRTDSDWSTPFKRRVFQVHTPNAMTIFFGSVERLSGNCRG